MAWTAAVGRTHFERRSGVLFSDANSLKDRLSELTETAPISEPVSPTNIAFLYTGQGSQWLGMGRALYDSEPVVRAVMDRCEEVFLEERGESLLDVMWGQERRERRSGRHGMGATSAVCTGVRVNGSMGERWHPAERRFGPQRRGDSSGTHRRRLLPRRRDAICDRAGHTSIGNRNRNNGRRIRTGGGSRIDG